MPVAGIVQDHDSIGGAALRLAVAMQVLKLATKVRPRYIVGTGGFPWGVRRDGCSSRGGREVARGGSSRRRNAVGRLERIHRSFSKESWRC